MSWEFFLCEFKIFCVNKINVSAKKSELISRISQSVHQIVRLGDSAGFDQNCVELGVFVRQNVERFAQAVVAKHATDTAVAEFDLIFAESSRNEPIVDIDFAKIVDDRADF